MSMKLTKWLVVLSITLAACSDDSANSSPDSAIPDGPGSPPPMPESGTPIGDSGDTDASTFPAPPRPARRSIASVVR